MFGENCYEGGKKHKFRPRHTEREREGLEIKTVTCSSAREFRDLITIREYVHDVCEWCGKVVKE